MAVLALLVPPRAWAKHSPEIEWETVRTAHFRVHSAPTLRRFSERLTAFLEEAYVTLSRDLHWELQGPAEVVVRGDVDLPNGLTSVFPLNRLVVNAVPFSPAGSIAEYDDWIRTLAYHELTHLISNDTTRGLFSLGRTVFGATAKMNPYQPQWLEEGLAVYEETATGSYGRGRSTFNDMVLRTAARDGLLQSADPLLGVTIDRLNDGVPYWPGGLTPYIYGDVLHELMVEVAGPDSPGKISYRNGGRLPFLIDGTADAELGMNFGALWNRAVEKLGRIAAADLEAIRRQPVTSVRPLTEIGRMTSAPAFSADGRRVYFVRDSYRSGIGLAEVELAGGKTREVTDWRYGGGTQLRSKGGWLLYSRYEPFEEFKLYSDVYLWDSEAADEYRLTEGARAADPDFSADFSWNRKSGIVAGAIVYVKNLEDGNQALTLWDGRQERQLYRGENFERLASPAWGRGPAAEWIAFALKKNGGGERLIAVRARDGAVRPLTAEPALRHNEVTPSWTARGTLLFASNDEGVYEVRELAWPGAGAESKSGGAWASGATVTPVRRTRLETGAFYPLEAPDGKLLAMVYGARGFDLAELGAQASGAAAGPALASLRDKLAGSAVVTGAAPTGALAAPSGGLATPAPLAAAQAPEDYSVWPAILPKYWSPFVQKLADGWSLGANLSGTDALDRHQYALLAAWDSRASFPIYDVLYRYEGLYPTMEARRIQENRYLGLFQASNVVDTTLLTFSYPIGYWNVTFGGTATQSTFFSRSAASGGAQARFAHGKVNVYPDSIDRDAGESGHRVDLTFTGYFVGSDQYWSGEARLEQRVPSFWDQHYFRFFAAAAHASNQDLSALYYVGGGESNISAFDSYLVRGYAPGELFGRDIAVLNAEYWFPLKNVFRGLGTMPGFYERAKIKLLADTGSSEYVAGQYNNFLSWPVGVGVHLLQDVKVLYRLPYTIAVGFDWGLNGRLAGEKQFVMGVFGRL